MVAFPLPNILFLCFEMLQKLPSQLLVLAIITVEGLFIILLPTRVT